MTDKTPITEAIILAGGLGTRLRGVIGEYPKPLAPVNDIPFLQLLLDYLATQNITAVTLAVGYKWELIEAEFGHQYKNITLNYSVEHERLGTGGAIKLALESDFIQSEDVFVINGDTLFTVDLAQLAHFHLSTEATCSIAVKSVTNSDRYGTIVYDNTGKISAFTEKQFVEQAYINGGIYCLKKEALADFAPSTSFSFEIDYLTAQCVGKKFYALAFDSYFKDIGIPTDYRQFAADILNKIVTF